MTFKELIQRAGINKAELARRLKVTATTVSEWGEKPPGYAEAYLNLLIEYNRVRP